MKNTLVLVLLLNLHLVACAPDNSFRGDSGRIHPADETPDNSPVEPPPEDPKIPNLNNDDQETIEACKQKYSALMSGVATVESIEISNSISNKEAFSDPYSGKEKRILILNITAPIANKISLRLGNPNTTYCLNIKSQIINKLDIGVAAGARLIEARQIGISNKISTHEI